jgi:hypothetical protein
MTRKPFPYEEFRQHMVALGYQLESVQARIDKIGEWWDGSMRGKYGDVPVRCVITRLDAKCMYVVEISAGERRKSAGLITLNRHHHGWRMRYISGWGSWLQDKDFTVKGKTLTYTQWGPDQRG